jgi:hypothetical protein
MAAIIDNIKAQVSTLMNDRPVVGLVVASFLVFAVVLFVSGQTIKPTGKALAKHKKAAKSPGGGSSRGKSPARRAPAAVGVRKSTRKRKPPARMNVDVVEGQSY